MLTAQFNAATVWPDGNSVESSGTTMKEATQKAFDTICAEYVELEGYTLSLIHISEPTRPY